MSKSIVYFKARFSIKKAIALSFLLFAGMVIMAHAVVPHHHYDDIIQLVNQCNNGGVEDCPLATVYVKLSTERQAIRSLNFNFDRLPCFSILFPVHSTPRITDDTSLSFRQKLYLRFYLSDYISQSFGLRAPPF